MKSVRVSGSQSGGETMRTVVRSLVVLLVAGVGSVGCRATQPQPQVRQSSNTVDTRWLDYPWPGIPRTKDGKADLAAPAPRTADGKPDFSGVWGLDAGPSLFWIAGDPTSGYAKPVVEKILAERDANLQFDDPIVHCLPEGPRFSHFVAFPKKIVQTPTLLIVLGEDLS